MSVCLSKTNKCLSEKRRGKKRRKMKRKEEWEGKRREERDIKDEMLSADNPFTPNTPWVIENDNNAARSFCTAAHRHMFLPAWHNCHSSSIFYRSNINLCCRSVRTVGGARQTRGSSVSEALWSACLHKTQPRTSDHTTGWVQRLRPHLYIVCHLTDLT